jgi:DNA-binding IclR family transcriptional regulator
MDADDLTSTDRDILDVLTRGRGGDEPWGRATKGHLVDETGRSRNSVYNRLETLRHAGVVRLLHDGTRLFEFVEDPRERGVE